MLAGRNGKGRNFFTPGPDEDLTGGGNLPAGVEEPEGIPAVTERAFHRKVPRAAVNE